MKTQPPRPVAPHQAPLAGSVFNRAWRHIGQHSQTPEPGKSIPPSAASTRFFSSVTTSTTEPAKLSGDSTPYVIPWEFRSFEFAAATTESTMISFMAYDGDGAPNAHMALDAVSLEIATVVPEPSAILMALTGALGLSARRRGSGWLLVSQKYDPYPKRENEILPDRSETEAKLEMVQRANGVSGCLAQMKRTTIDFE